MSRVVRIQTGDEIEIFNEKGRGYIACAECIESSFTRLRILDTFSAEQSEFKLILAPALIKLKALEIVIQKATELGAASISPVIADRSIVKYDSKIQNKLTRWNKIILDASKQSKRITLPEIREPLPLKKFMETGLGEKGMGLCLNQHESVALKKVVCDYAPPTENVVLLVGPEGDWTEQEKRAIVQHGFRMVSLGRMTLRSETAAISGMAIISHFWMS